MTSRDELQVASWLDELIAAIRQASDALAADDEGAFESAMARSAAAIDRISPRLGALAGRRSGAIAQRLHEASVDHARLVALATARRDRLAGALAGLNRHDPVASAYGESAEPRLSVRY